MKAAEGEKRICFSWKEDHPCNVIFSFRLKTARNCYTLCFAKEQEYPYEQ